MKSDNQPENEYQHLSRAIKWAAKLHLTQFRDGDHPLPYIVHPIEVLSNLRYVGGIEEESMLIVAVLHDTVEEGGTTLAKIQEKFGERVAALVEELTRYEPTESEKSGLTTDQIWQLRSDLLLAEIAKMSKSAQTIKLADRLSNVQEAYRSKSGKELTRYIDQTQRILTIIPREANPGLWDAIASAAGN